MNTEDDIIARLKRIEKSVLTIGKNVLTIAEAAQVTDYSVKYLRTLIARNEITYFKRGNRIYFNRRDLEEWMTQERIPSEGDIEAKAARR
jgi:excisionase family DNA binding protein